MGHGPHSSKLVVICVVLSLFVLFYVLFVFVLFYVLFACKCVLYHCHWALTQLHLTDISYHIRYTAVEYRYLVNVFCSVLFCSAYLIVPDSHLLWVKMCRFKASLTLLSPKLFFLVLC